MRVDELPCNNEELSDILERSFLIDMPALFPDLLERGLIVSYWYILDMALSVPGIGHMDGDVPFMFKENPCVHISIDFREFAKPLENNVFIHEVGLVLIESVCNEQRAVVHPDISRSCTEHDPFVSLSDLDEGIGPDSRTNGPLLVENEKRILYARILLNIVP
jgi:hypothetical protein